MRGNGSADLMLRVIDDRSTIKDELGVAS